MINLIRIQRLPAALINHLDNLIGGLPTLRRPVRERHSRTFLALPVIASAHTALPW